MYVHISPKRKLLLSVLALAGIAIGVDRFILPADAGPAQAAADLIPSALESKADKAQDDPAGKPKPGTVSSAASSRRVAVRLAAFARTPADTDPPADAFAPPAAWLARISPPSPQVDQPAHASSARSNPAAPVAPAFRLTLVSRQAGVAVAAVINGVRIGVGESIDGYRLVGLAASEPAGPANRPGRPAQAVLEGPTGSIQLALDPLPASPGAD